MLWCVMLHYIDVLVGYSVDDIGGGVFGVVAVLVWIFGVYYVALLLLSFDVADASVVVFLIVLVVVFCWLW